MKNVHPLADRALERLANNRWAFDESRVSQYAFLMNEYLKLSACWAKALGVPSKWPFFDIVQHALPSLVLPYGYEEQVVEILNPTPVRPIVVNTCVWYVKWELSKDIAPGELDHYSLRDPFASLLDMYDEGGTFVTEHGFINIGLAGIPAMIRGLDAYC